LYLIVAGLIVGEDLADVVDWPLYHVDVPGLLPLHYQGSADDLGVAAIYRRSVSPGFDEARIRGMEMSALRLSSDFYVLSVQWMESDFF
jgi:hypothetical protein